ncbi:MAG: siphovirus ReqiPepy6 Gp37-like family protein [Chloroflexi bacterium]|nr:siphovirus ReqiPepy6 Gp37-like family protein [Chloroflexota bacterium]
MATDYKLRLKSRTGSLLAEIACQGQDDGSGVYAPVLHLEYSKAVNEPGLAMFVLPANHTAIADLADKAQVEIWRRNAHPPAGDPFDWYCDFYGLFRDFEYRYTDRELFTAYCPGQLSMLSWRHIMWHAGTSNRTKFTGDPAETIAKTLVTYNITSAATTAAGRRRSGAGAPADAITVQADAAGGNTVDWYCSWANLLETLQKLAAVGGGDFDLVRTGDYAWEFRWYTGQLGTNRSATLTFSLELGNMGSPVYRLSRSSEASVAVVAGQGQESARDTVTRAGNNYSATHDIELFVDANDIPQGATDALNTRGDQKLDEAQAREDFSFQVLQTPTVLYGRDYFLGDTARAVYRGFDGTVQIRGVTVTQAAGQNEKVDVVAEAV